MKAEKVVGVPEKGRNGGIALRKEGIENADLIVDVLNGVGKLYAKTGKNRHWIEKMVDSLDSVELKDRDRPFRRPVFTQKELEDTVIRSYSEPLEEGLDSFYQGLDRFAEQQNLELTGEKSLYEEVAEEAGRRGYMIDELYGDPVSWAAINTDLGKEPEKVLLPDEFPDLGRSVAQNYWDESPEYGFFSEFGVEEEQTLAETSDEVAGVYMVVSGGTAEDYDLEYDAVPGFGSRLARFEQRPENRFKNSEGNRL